MIFIFTSICDPHVDAVVKCLNLRNVNFIRINSEDLFDSKVTFSYLITESTYCLNITSHGRQWNVEKINVVYYRRPEKLILEKEDVERQIQIDELWSSIHAILFSFPDAIWLGHPLLDKVKSAKTLQHFIARKLLTNKIKLPDSLVSNLASVFEEFGNKYDDVILKPLNSRGVLTNSGWVPFFTERLNSSLLTKSCENQDRFNFQNAYFFQNYIQKKVEWRITVIGNSFFPCIIYSQENEFSANDWRKVDYTVVRHQSAEISNELKEFCQKFMRDLGVIFGAFDFIENELGEFYFLECNVNGQWLWIEELTGMKISAEIANFLIAQNEN